MKVLYTAIATAEGGRNGRARSLDGNLDVTLVSPKNTWIEFGATIGQDTVVEPFCWIGSGASIGAGEHVAAGSVITRGRQRGDV